MTLWTFLKSDKRKRISHRRKKTKNDFIQRASFCTCLKASYTLEAAVIIPLLAAYLVTLLFFFRILEVQRDVEEALLYAGRKTAVESSVVEEEELLFVSAEAYFLYALKDSGAVERYVKNGMWGISLFWSEFQDEDIVLRADYVVELPISFWDVGRIHLSSQNHFRKWVGDRELEEEGEYVYVAATGTVYHTSLACRSINLSVQATTVSNIPQMRGKNGQKYQECSRCEWKDICKERVYYTDYGTLYHKDIACSAIKRTVEKIKLEEVGEKRICSFCKEA